MRRLTRRFIILTVCLLPVRLTAIEIPLEGFGKTTKIAYVNMHKIFESFPETQQARLEMNRVIEEKKADITLKREEIAQLTVEIEFLRKQRAAVMPSTAPVETGLDEIEVGAVLKEPEPLTVLSLPEDSPLSFMFSPPPETEEEGQEIFFSTFSTDVPEILPGVPSPAPKLEEKEILLLQLETDLEAFIGAAEEEVRQIQEGKTMILMARIYRSLEDIASKEGYSIIVDKEQILFGEDTVDITESVIWRLSAPDFR